ncbi:uncharacterized protein LOC112179197 [Rosa chinensis]|uniref:uncharacterized protein LOC112179197 n=1 Tax=Rosa chinensis TaxID=74649 RepID=UPI001AD92E16|nr:uncharacterized protein LOC112179197 [Rosa chinensis]
MSWYLSYEAWDLAQCSVALQVLMPSTPVEYIYSMQTNESRYCTCLFGFEEEVKSSYCSGFFLKQSNFKIENSFMMLFSLWSSCAKGINFCTQQENEIVVPYYQNF